jgi:hypothetical protein
LEELFRVENIKSEMRIKIFELFKTNASPFLSHSALFTLINKDGRANSRISLQSNSKIVSFLIGIAVIWMLIKAIQKIFSKIKDNNRYKEIQ